jgi:hypothetical protein
MDDDRFDPSRISPKVVGRLMRALDDPASYDERGRNIGSEKIRGKIAWDPVRMVTMILPPEEWRQEVQPVDRRQGTEAEDH